MATRLKLWQDGLSAKKRKVFVTLGLGNVKILLASGNMILMRCKRAKARLSKKSVCRVESAPSKSMRSMPLNTKLLLCLIGAFQQSGLC